MKWALNEISQDEDEQSAMIFFIQLTSKKSERRKKIFEILSLKKNH